jgi:membrane protein implicated in regulation of membrane protease activity
MAMLYWHWLVLGMLLAMAEIFVPSFTLLWFGAGAFVVGLISWLAPLSFTAQLWLWVISSVLFTIGWFKLLKPLMADHTKAGLAREAAIGETGQVIRLPIAGGRGRVRFTTPLMGDDEWDFIAADDGAALELGDRVFVKEISGNTLIVTTAS